MHAFTYHRATDVADALARLRSEPDAKLLAGGMTLLPSMKHRLAAPPLIVDIGRLQALRRLDIEPDAVTLGAGWRHAEVAAQAELLSALPSLAALAGTIGDMQVRSRGTLGGSLANNDPAADYPAAVLALGASVLTDRREIAAGDFFVGMFSTALAADEIVVAVRFPRPLRAAYAKFRHPASGYAMAAAFVADFGASGVRVAITGAGPCVFRWAQAEAALTQRLSPDSLQGLELDADGLIADLHAPAAYRAHLANVMARRCVQKMTTEEEIRA